MSEMSLFLYLLIILGCPWLTYATSAASKGCRESRVSRLVAYVDKSAANVKAGPPCYCSWWSCFYCPGDTYCTVDNSGCCPRPGCRNGCGRWCLCPSFPICCPDGACPEDYPKCCGKVCCKEGANCCEGEGQHCCEAGTSCCGNGCCAEKDGMCCRSAETEENLCCVKEELQLEEGDIKETDKEEGSYLETLKSDEDIFKYLCQTFENFLPKQKPQYAILVVGRLSQDYQLDPKPEEFDSKGLAIGNNYAAARFTPGGKHTEDIILAYTDDMVNKYKGKYGENPPLFLFSKNSPCCGSPLVQDCANGCAGKINAKLWEIRTKVTSMVIAWDKNYKLGAMPFDKAFLFSLNSILSPGNAELSWNANGYCRTSTRNWFQKEMFACLIETAEKHFFCTTARVEGDLARLVNKVTWICGTRSTIEDEFYPAKLVYDDDGMETLVPKSFGTPPARDPDCWKTNVKSLDSAWPCSQLAQKAFECAQQYQDHDLGPALQPSSPTTFSNSAVDVKGDYGQLCFSSGSCRVSGGSQSITHLLKTDPDEETETKDEL